MNENLYVSKVEAGRMLGVGTRQVKRYMDEGRVEWDREKVSGRVRILRSSVLALKQSPRVASRVR